MSENLVQLISLGGGLAGYVSIVSVGYLYWKKSRKKVRIYLISATYKSKVSSHEGFSEVTVNIEMGFLNDSEEAVSITDIVGFLNYDKSKYDKAIASQPNISKIPMVYPSRPNNFQETVNFSIPPHETLKRTIVMNFKDVVLSLVDRMGVAHFAGFNKRGNVGTWIVMVDELEEKWNEMALDFLMAIHINGNKIKYVHGPVYPKTEKGKQGTIAPAEEATIIMRLERGKKEQLK
jgi:hypothetical protein